MAEYAILASHPAEPNLLIGLPLDAESREDATVLAFHILHSYRIPGPFFPFTPGSKSGIYLVTYTLGPTTRLTAIEASSRVEAEAHLQHLSIEGRIVTADQRLT